MIELPMHDASHTYDYWTLVSVVLSILLIWMGLHHAHRLMVGLTLEGNPIQLILAKVLCSMLFVFMMVYVANAVIWVRRDAVSEEQAADFLRTISTLFVMVFSFFFGRVSRDKEDK